MPALEKGSALYKEIFGDANPPTALASAFPTYGMMKNGFLDPANRTISYAQGVLNASGVTDLRAGIQVAIVDLVTASPVASAVRGVAYPFLSGVKALVQSANIPPELTDPQVLDGWLKAGKSGDYKKLAGAALGTALGILGVSVPVVGTIAAAVVGLATAVYRVMEAGTKSKVQPGTDEAKALLYRYFPPMQESDSDMDAEVVNKSIRARMVEHDWTPIYMPRYKGDWHGEARSGTGGEGGFAFAPGVAKYAKDILNADAGESFTPWTTNDRQHLGVIPGTSSITSIVQVSLPHDVADRNGVAASFFRFLQGGLDPRNQDNNGVRGYSRVIDTGTFYPTSGRVAGALWNWAGCVENPLKFRIDTRALVAWKTYCEGGIAYIRKVCYPWAKENTYNQTIGSGTLKDQFFRYNPNSNFEGYFGPAIFKAIGVFGCARLGDPRNTAPEYRRFLPPSGVPGYKLGPDERLVYGALESEINSKNSGPFLPIINPERWPDQCMGTRWDRGELPIQEAARQMRAAQLWDLRNSAISIATCSVQDAAFGDPTLLDLLLQARAALLKSGKRHQVSLDDISDEEPGLSGIVVGGKSGDGLTWKQQLKASGLIPGGKYLSKKARDFGILGPGEPPPEQPSVQGGPSPWNVSGKAAPPRADDSGLVLFGALTTAALCGGAAVAYMRRKRR